MPRRQSNAHQNPRSDASASPKGDCVAIIPARAGSKRIPGKNTRDFLGQPIIAYSIAAAQRTSLFRRIIVSTDSDAIAAISRDYGAETPFLRPAELADDHTGTAEVLLHAIKWLIASDKMPDYFCCIYPAAPLISPESLIEGHRKLSRGAPAVISVGKYMSPIWRALHLNEDEHLQRLWPEYQYMRTQDLADTYFDAGQFYWRQTTPFLADGCLLPPGSRPICLPSTAVLDIDTEEDWRFAEYLAQYQDSSVPRSAT